MTERPTLPVYVVDCGRAGEVLGIAWADLARVAKRSVLDAEGPAHIAPGIVSIVDALAVLPFDVGTRAEAREVKGFDLPAYARAPTRADRPGHMFGFLKISHDVAVTDAGGVLINWTVVKDELQGYMGPSPKRLDSVRAPYTYTTTLEDLRACLLEHGGHWKIRAVLAALTRTAIKAGADIAPPTPPPGAPPPITLRPHVPKPILQQASAAMRKR